MEDNQKRTYRFHDPNPPEETAVLLLRIFLEAHRDQMRRSIAQPAGRNGGAPMPAETNSAN